MRKLESKVLQHQNIIQNIKMLWYDILVSNMHASVINGSDDIKAMFFHVFFPHDRIKEFWDKLITHTFLQILKYIK